MDDMYEIDTVFLLIWLSLSIFLILRWYIVNVRKPDMSGVSPLSLGLLYLFPLLVAVPTMYTLTTLASYDVVSSPGYITYYFCFGYVVIWLGLYLFERIFDLTRIDDILENHNIAAVFPYTAVFIALTCIYCAANVGDGPGAWCVIFAAFLGIASLFLLIYLINAFTGIIKKVTVERDALAALRFSGYLLAAGLILGRASTGDWTSFGATIVEFLAGWPLLPLTLVYIVIEMLYQKKEKPTPDISPMLITTQPVKTSLFSTLFLLLAFVAYAIATVILLPAPNENPLYRDPEYFTVIFRILL